MGILDDAIREHLDLKRRRGADDSELRRLEDEAFGPPSRPGEPDFPDGNGEPAGDAESDVDAEALTQVQEPTATALADVEDGAEEHAVIPEADGEAAEPAAETDEPAAESALYDAELDLGDLDLNLDQELGEQDFWDDEDSAEPVAEVAEEAEEPAVEADGDAIDEVGAEAAEPVEAPPPGLRVEQLDTVEHQIQIEEAEADEAPVGDPPLEEAIAEGLEDDEELLVDDDLGGDEDPLEDLVDDESDDVNVVLGDLDDEESDEDAEDVLEETPEFLRDDPEDDELWFEQGEPKDFDFEE
jgi:hypothetical protein